MSDHGPHSPRGRLLLGASPYLSSSHQPSWLGVATQTATSWASLLSSSLLSPPHPKRKALHPPHIDSPAHRLREKAEGTFGVIPIPGALPLACRQDSPSLGHLLCGRHPCAPLLRPQVSPRAQSYTCLWGSALHLSESRGRNSSSVSRCLRPRVRVARGQA